ncbi:hypothetical protein R7V41_03045 [Mesomycoplasma ovipneumoniae]|uniref:Lipoprotein n=1 Tax=Mesomycoplasma ovipneumoniae TaxID=29562 RepID=A0AAJ2UE25_9BACT|nr:hypothetical protein [Mesomycoplasma ovipneumoniae]MDW2906575.1 hypothetical protein [Mesomycoplasma ovipneumoniae]MDW2914483.1 hypothetical protein [Mesomycoplasma ovipneumoniae]
MLHLIYKKLKKQKILLLTTSFLALPTLLISCADPHQESSKNISKSPTPGQGNNNPGNNNPVEGNNNPKTTNPEKASPISEEYSEIISNSVLGFNGQKKNPKVAKNRFDVTKHYTEEIPEASFISGKGGTGKYGLLPYWYFLQSIPKYLENKGFINNNKYNKEEYLKRLEYFDKKESSYFYRNLVRYQNEIAGIKGEFEVWKQDLHNQYKKIAEQKKANPYVKYKDLINKDRVVHITTIREDDYFPIIKPELDSYNAQIPDDKKIKYSIVFDFLLATERIWPSSVDEWPFSNQDEFKEDKARYFRDEYYIEKGYKPSEPEKLWYELGLSMLRVERIIRSIKITRNIFGIMTGIEIRLFELTDQNKEIDDQLFSKLLVEVDFFTDFLADFLKPEHHLNLRKDLVFNIDISNNQDDQSLISDFIDYYNQKIAPMIWRINLKRKYNKLPTLTKILKNLHVGYYFNKYLKPLLPEIKDLPDEEDVENDKTLSDETKEKARQEARKAGIKAWGIWLKNYQEKYGINFKPDPEIDQEYFDYASLYPVPTPPVPTPESTEKPVPSSTLDSPSSTLDNTQQIPEQIEVINEESEPQKATVESQSEPVENTNPSNTEQPNNIEEQTEVIEETQEAVAPQGLN